MVSLAIPSVKYRRLRGDGITVYKLLNGLEEVDWQIFGTLSKSDNTRGSHRELYIKYSKTSIKKNAFINRAFPISNAVSDVTKLALSINNLKNLLDMDQHLNIHMKRK